MKSPISKDATITGMKPNFRPHLKKWGIIFGLTTLYITTFESIINSLGPVGAVFISIPVATAGWFFGVNAGLVASLMGIILNTALLTLFTENNWIQSITKFWPGILIVILVGYISGQLSQIIKEYKSIETNLRSRERYLTLLKMATNDILGTKDPDDKYHGLITHFINLLVADYGYFFRWDAKQEHIILVASTLPAEQQFSSVLLKPDESAIIKSIWQTDHPLVIDNVSNLLDTFNATFFKNLEFPAHSALVIPISAREHKLGVIILAYNVLHHFTAEDIIHAEQGGQQVALALWNVQQEIDIKKRLRESNALTKIMRTLSETERIGLQTVLQLIVTSAKELIPGAEQAVIHLLDKDGQFLEAQAVSGYENTSTNWMAIKIQPNEGVAGQVLVSGQTVNIADVEKDSRFVTYAEPPKYRSLIVAPVQSGEQKLGTISVQSASVSAFTEGESRLLSALGTQAAIAIENAHLLESIQQALKESNALYRINQGLVASLEPQELLKDVVDLLQKNFGYYQVQIYVLDPETGDFVMSEGSGEIGRQLKEQGYRLRAGEGIIGYTADTGAPFFTNDVDKVHFFVRSQLLSNTKSELSVPVKIGGHVLGVLDVQQIPPALLTQRDLQLVNAVADQLSIALQKANLYSDLQAALQTEKAIRNQMVQSERLVTMGRLLASVSHELNNPLQAIQNALFLLREEKGISLQGKLDLDIVLSEAERMSALIERLRSTYRPIQAEDFLPTQINQIIEDIHALISTHLRHNEIIYEFFPDPALPLIPALPNQIRQVILNLLMNAVEIMTSGGKLTVSTKLLQDSNEVLLSVSDTGPGIDPDLLPNVFEAFITNKQRGTGLGLTISYDIVMKHHGRITAENNPEAGALFQVWLPINNREIE
jgi:signal transduction histidine kinase/GTP-sensing pleiotropic transcriptional regulator CodY